MSDNVYETLSCACSRRLLGQDDSERPKAKGVASSLQNLLKEAADLQSSSCEIVSIGDAALQAFLRTNVTGPPLEWNVDRIIPPNTLLPTGHSSRDDEFSQLIAWLSVDGEAVYQLIPDIELFIFAKILLNAPALLEVENLPRARLRVNTWHQRLLNQPSPTLESLIYKDLESIEKNLISRRTESKNEYADFLLERAMIHLLHGFDAKARADLKQAAEERSFDFVLTGRFGKRTKFQQHNISQLVVLARSAEKRDINSDKPHLDSRLDPSSPSVKKTSMPQALSLEDDTLLESISFEGGDGISKEQISNDDLPPSLADIDPGNQPVLDPLDAIILLAIASSITNTSPTDGLTREGTLPYAERVISGGSSNWQVYTQALLVRSRIEGYRTRTTQRGVLQLQALVDQVLAETTKPVSRSDFKNHQGAAPVNTFLPRPKPSESASAKERLRYIHQLATPARWRLESELADRWVALGALRTALEIYERLQLWAEAALCMAAEGKEMKARRIICNQLYRSTTSETNLQAFDDDEDDSEDDSEDESEDEHLVERDPLPADASRLFCILGDLENSPSAYERAWEISNERFARAQRSLGKYWFSKGNAAKADEAYAKSLKVNPQNHSAWFALGCIRLQTESWSGAVDAFGRAVQIDDIDGESWSNLAVSLLRLPGGENEKVNNIRGAFTAMKKATAIRRDNSKMWQNLLAIAIQLSPPPYAEIVMAQSRLIELLGNSQGESAVDVPVVEALLAYVIDTDDVNARESKGASPAKGLRKLVIDLIIQRIAPLVTTSRSLWLLIAKLSIHLNRPLAALSTYEKAWRTALNQPGWDSSSKQWKDVSDATIELIDAYESLGEKNRESGLGEGEMVAKDWKFKARSAARSVMARAKEGWEEDEGYRMLNERLDQLKAT